MAVGEAACVSVHGANRLGSNSLIDLVVFGKAAGMQCGQDRQHRTKRIAICRRMRATRRWRASTNSATPRAAHPPPHMRLAMQKAMQEDAAVFRTGETLEKGQQAHR